ncbi:hypothetical protein CVT25_013396 [Psilocybe cyanescens]|uniref:Uncharacterized protein n=1 Tax=Psilocybe cyanescens TaxID=93625 RepID=A0A409WSQ8_PSICY|nr:hypothetical protein CVT25_013396 [Psilocybe cyanescens]
MSSYLARRACGALCRSLPTRSILAARSLHLTPIVQKKKSNAVLDNDDLFSDDYVEEDLITEALSTSNVGATETPAAVSEQPAVSKKGRKTKLTPEARKSRFETQLGYLEPRLGRRPEVKNPRIRKRSLITLAQLAASEEELRKVAELFPKYKAAGLEFLPDLAAVFARRCQELACPSLALTVFGNYAKYNLHLTLEAGQWLVLSVAVNEPRQLQIALALFNIYKLPPIAEDVITASIISGAYSAIHKSPQLKEIVEDLRQPISDMLKTTNIFRPSTPDAAKRSNWVLWSLHNANKSYTAKAGQPFVDPTLIPSGKKIAVERPTAEP